MTARSDDTVALDDWDTHWGDYASAAEDNPAQRFRRSLAFELLDAGGAPERLFDIGAGQGDLLAAARRRWPQVELAGVELSRTGVDAARRKVPDATLYHANLLADPPRASTDPPGAAGTAPSGHTGWATHAVCSEVLEHVDDPVRLLANARPFLAPGCRLVVTVPGGPRSAFDRHIGHRRHYDRRSITAVLAEAGFGDVRAEAAGFPVFNLYKLIVILRGQRVVEDAREAPSRLAQRTMGLFDRAFRFAFRRGRLGWQIVATAKAV